MWILATIAMFAVIALFFYGVHVKEKELQQIEDAKAKEEANKPKPSRDFEAEYPVKMQELIWFNRIIEEYNEVIAVQDSLLADFYQDTTKYAKAIEICSAKRLHAIEVVALAEEARDEWFADLEFVEYMDMEHSLAKKVKNVKEVLQARNKINSKKKG